MAKPTLYTKQGTDRAIARAIAPLATRADLEGLATKADVADVAHASALAGLATKAELAGYATKADVAGVAHASDLASLATKDQLAAALKNVGITICSTEAEAQALPDGALYFLASGAAQPPTPPPGPAPATGPSIVTSTAGQVIGQTIPITTDGKDGDKLLVVVNTKATVASAANVALPQGWEQIVAPYWVGTMRFTLIAGPWAPTINITLSQNAEIGWASVLIRGASTIEAGQVKKRQAEPAETTTCTAPALAGDGIVLGVACERTSGGETSEQVTLSQGWEKVAYAAQEGANYQTVVIAKRLGSSPQDMVVSYPNAQGSNGAGVQVIARA